MNYMLEALGRDIRAMWNRFAWHPTIDAMQEAMLREVWRRWEHMKTYRHFDPAVGVPLQGLTMLDVLRLFEPLVTHYADEHGNIHRELYNKPSDAQSEIDRINRIWATPPNAFEREALRHNQREESLRNFCKPRAFGGYL